MVEVIDSDLEDASQLEETIRTAVNPDHSLRLSYTAV
jgi:hypothetical protein